MAKPLTLDFRGTSLDFALNKVDRDQLYGYVETEVVDESGKPCELVTLAGDGHTLIGRGGTALGYFSPTGEWRKKSELVPVDVEGNRIVPVKSTFDAPVPLERTVTVEEFLNHNIGSVYQLMNDSIDTAFLEELTKGMIFQFPFSYRGGLEAHAGFVLRGSDGNIFLLVGSPTQVEFIGLNQPAPAVVEESTAEEEDDLLDFNLV